MSIERYKIIEDEYPYPIAATLRKVRTIDSDDVINKHDSLGDLFEIIVKYLAILSIQDYKSRYGTPQYLEDFLKKMIHPSLGHWNEIIRTVSTEEISRCPVATNISIFYGTKISQELRKECDYLQDIIKSKISLKNYKDVFDLLILYRNKVKGHGAKISKNEYKARVSSIEEILMIVLEEIEFIKKYNLIYVNEINVLPTHEYKHKIKSCMSTQIEPSSIVKNESLSPSHLYIELTHNEKTYYLDLYPLITLYNCQECKSDQLFVFNDYRKNRLEFLSYTCGHLIYPEMLSKEFEQYFKLSLSVISDDDEDRKPVTDEEAAEYAEMEYYNGMEKISSKAYYEALEHLLLSISYKASWKANYYSALILMLLKGSPSEVLFHLNACQQLDPDSSLSNDIRYRYLKVFDSNEKVRNPQKQQLDAVQEIAQELMDESVYVPEVKSIYYYILPCKLRNYSFFIWMVVPSILIGLRTWAGNEFLYPSDTFVQILKILMVTLFVSTIHLIAYFKKELYYALSEQVVPKFRGRFQEWYQEQINRIYGVFDDNQSVFNKQALKNKYNKENFILFIVLLPIAIFGAVYLTTYGQVNMYLTLMEMIDYTIIWLVVVPGGSIVLKTFTFLRNYSGLPLKPIISAVNQHSINKVGKMILMVSIPYTILFFTLTLIGYLSFSQEVVVAQLLLFYFMVCIGLVWTILTPYYFSNALKKAKDNVLAKYNRHIENAFQELISHPDSESLEKYKWLKNQQKEMLSISTSSFTITITIGIILLNMFIVTVAILYPFFKYQAYYSDVLLWLEQTFIF